MIWIFPIASPFTISTSESLNRACIAHIEMLPGWLGALSMGENDVVTWTAFFLRKSAEVFSLHRHDLASDAYCAT